ncbi:MAG: hypothetical protein U9N72_09120 [Bacteroidota bacterium]|nr:hypothetical protein [Bacteroidota bacterium]
MNKKILPLILLISLFCLKSNAQYEREDDNGSSLSERVFFGGGFSLQLGTITNIELAPVAGLWLLPRLAVAAGPSWQYYKNPMGRTSIYGGRSFLRFLFIQDLSKLLPVGRGLGFFAHGEYEALNLESEFWKGVYPDNSRFWEHNALAGLGLSQSLGRKASFNITFLWAVTESEYQIYNNPEIRIDFLF